MIRLLTRQLIRQMIYITTHTHTRDFNFDVKDRQRERNGGGYNILRLSFSVSLSQTLFLSRQNESMRKSSPVSQGARARERRCERVENLFDERLSWPLF